MLYKDLIQEIEDMKDLFDKDSKIQLQNVPAYLDTGHLFFAIEDLNDVLINLPSSEFYLIDIAEKWINDIKQFISKGIWISYSGDVFTFDEMINNKIIDYCYDRNGFMVTYACNLDGCVYLPDSVYAIKDGAFCLSKVQEVYIGKNTNLMGYDVFNSCPVEVVYFNDIIEEINSCTCKNCKNLKIVYIGKSVHTIRDNAFFNTSIEQIILPENLKRIEYGAFENCKYLKSVMQIGNNLQRLDGHCFSNCNKLLSFDILESVTRCDESNFDNCKNTTIYIHVKDKRYIPFKDCFKDCEVVVIED